MYGGEEGCVTLGGIMSTLDRYLEYIGGWSVYYRDITVLRRGSKRLCRGAWRDIMIHVEDIMSTSVGYHE